MGLMANRGGMLKQPSRATAAGGWRRCARGGGEGYVARIVPH